MHPSGRALLAACALGVSLGVGSCADGASRSADERSDERTVTATVEAFQAARSAEDVCGKLTDEGRRYVLKNFGNGKAESCEALVGPNPGRSAEPPPKVGPVGVSGDFALAVVQFGGDTPESFVYTLKRVDGTWLIDCPCVVPDPSQIEGEVSDEAKGYANSPQGREAAGLADTDGDYEDVVAVGDLALAYGPDTEVLVNDGNGWRVAPISIGAY